jgi:DNA-binding MarR family transcriptional regulator
MSDPSAADSIEQIVIAGVALTTVAIASARPAIELSFPQWRVIVILGEAGEALRISEVARRIGVTLPAASRQLRRLERRGLISLRPDASDRRAAVVELTDDGHRARDAVMRHRLEQLRQLAAPLESSSEARRQLARAAEALRPARR